MKPALEPPPPPALVPPPPAVPLPPDPPVPGVLLLLLPLQPMVVKAASSVAKVRREAKFMKAPIVCSRRRRYQPVASVQAVAGADRHGERRELADRGQH